MFWLIYLPWTPISLISGYIAARGLETLGLPEKAAAIAWPIITLAILAAPAIYKLASRRSATTGRPDSSIEET